MTINEHGLQERQRTTKTGKTSVRYSVQIDATPLTHVIDTHELGRGPAQAIADHLRKRIETIPAMASPTTIARRNQAARAFAAGDPETLKRYSGGRMGPMPPNTSAGGRLFNDSGRLAKGLAVNKGARNEWIINVPAARFNPDTLYGPPGRNGLAALQEIYARLIELVPEFGSWERLKQVASVREAIDKATKDVIRRNGDLRERLSRARLQALRGALGLIASRL